MTEETVKDDVKNDDVRNEDVDNPLEEGEGKEDQIESQSEIKEEVKAETDQEKQDKYVPLPALHEERTKRKRLQSQVDEYAQKVQRMEQAFAQLIEQKRKENGPSFEDDPANFLRQDLEQTKQLVIQQRQQNEIAAQRERIVNQYRDSAAQFSKSQQDFGQAYSYVLNQRKAEYEAAGYTPEQSRQFVEEDEIAIASKAMQDGENPAKRVYDIAKARGYKPTNGKQQKDLDNIEKGLNASKSLSKVNGKTSESMTLEQLADVKDPAEFNRLFDKLIAQGG